jgi:hypothetical protein
MPTAITARRVVDYRTVTGLVGMFIFGLILVPPFGGAHNWGLSVIGAVVFGLASIFHASGVKRRCGYRSPARVDSVIGV